jgi:hypothetical protein
MLRCLRCPWSAQRLPCERAQNDSQSKGSGAPRFTHMTGFLQGYGASRTRIPRISLLVYQPGPRGELMTDESSFYDRVATQQKRL